MSSLQLVNEVTIISHRLYLKLKGTASTLDLVLVFHVSVRVCVASSIGQGPVFMVFSSTTMLNFSIALMCWFGSLQLDCNLHNAMAP